MELLIGFLILGAAVAVVTLVGNFIWVLAAAAWSAAFGTPAAPPPRRHPRECPGCRAQLLPTDRTCPSCGLHLDSRLAAALQRLRSSQHDVRQLADRGELDAATAEQVATLLGRRAETLMAEATERPVATPVRTAGAPARYTAFPPPTRPADVPPAAPLAPPAPAGTDAQPTDAPPASPPEHRRAGVLSAFLEERNILWGELAGGLLIVGCSIALVLSLWQRLEALPYFPLVLAAGVTAALFGAGQYTLHHWKLAATSRGLLLIALLLVPLNLLLLATPGVDAAGGRVDAAVKLVAVGVFVGMVRASGRDLIDMDLLPGPVDRRWLLALAVVGAPASLSLPGVWAGDHALPVWLPLACYALACHAVLGGLTWYRPRGGPAVISRPQGTAVLTFAGVSLFALLATWGLVLARAADDPTALLGFALPLVVAGVTIAESGLLVQRRAGDAGLKTTGTGVALAGSVLLVAGIAFAWPDPLRLTLAGAFVGAVFTRAAWRDGLPWLHVGAIPAFALVAVLGTHGLLGHWPVPTDASAGGWLARLLGSSTNGVILTDFALVLVAVAEGIVRLGNRAHAVAYGIGAAAVGAAGLLLVSVHGVDEPWPAVLVHAGCVTGLVLAHPRWQKRILADVAVWLVLAGTLWTLRAVVPDDPLRRATWVTSSLAVLFLLFPSAGLAPAWAGLAAWLAALWVVLAWAWREPGAFPAAQCALALAAVLGGLGWVERQEWWETSALGAADPRALQAFGVCLALLSLGWVAARRAGAGSQRLKALGFHDPSAVDRLVVAAVVVGQLVLLAVAIEPAVRAELTPLGWWTPYPPPAELAFAFGPGAWLLLGLLAAVLLATLRFLDDAEPVGDVLAVGLAVLGVSAAVAWAGAFGPDVAAASALRWGLAAAFLLGSAALWARGPLVRLAARGGFRTRVTGAATVGGYAVFAAAAVVVVLLTLSLTQLGLAGEQPGGPAEGSVFARIGYTVSFLVPLVLLVVGLAGSAVRERRAEFAFAGGVACVGTVAAGYALSVVVAGEPLDAPRQVRLTLFAAGSAAAWALAWLAAGRRVPGGPLLAVQSALGLAVTGLLAAVPLARLAFNPAEPLPPAFADLGRTGWLALAAAGWAGLATASRQVPAWRSHVVGFAAVAAGVLAACTVQPWDEPGRGVSFYTMVAVWAAAGLGLTAEVFAATIAPRGRWVAVLAGAIASAALLDPSSVPWAWAVALAGYALATAGIAAALARRVTDPTRWAGVFLAEGVVAVVAVALGLMASVGEDRLGERLAGPLAVVVVAVAAGVLAGVTPSTPARSFRLVAVVAAAVGAVLLGWAVPDRDAPALWLQRNGWAFVALVGSAVVYLEGVPRLRPDSAWAAATRRAGAGLVVAALFALAVVVLQQLPLYDPGTRRTPLTRPAVLAMLAGVAALIVLSVRFALRPAADPFSLPDARRTRYVYLAELLLVAVFFLVKLNVPELFLGQAVRYWTFLVMVNAFIGVGLAELFERRRLPVLAGPLRRTGVLLPLVPLVAFWAKPPAALLDFAAGRAPGARPFLDYLDKLPQHFDNYAGLWFLAGLLYGLVALARGSFGWGLLGALAANAGVWALLTHTGVPAAAHPQVWVIPLALIVLASEHINRRELQPGVSAGLRYLGTGLLYVSSAAEMFIVGVGESLWQPVVLAVLCVAGVLAGVALRVRAFLFLGAGFLLLDVFAMIWHAAVDRAQTWVWYASGILLGAAILALFAVFEKRRNDVLGVVERVRRWD